MISIRNIYFIPLFLIMLSPTNLLSQIFNGEVTYEISIIDSTEMLSIFLDKSSESVRCTYELQSNFLSGKSFTADSTVNSSFYQDGNDANIFIGDNEYDFNYLYRQGISYDFVRKTTEKENILGKKCTKYIYLWGRIEVHAWIADEKYQDYYEKGFFYRKIFFPHGLAYKYVYLHSRGCNVFKMTSVDMY